MLFLLYFILFNKKYLMLIWCNRKIRFELFCVVLNFKFYSLVFFYLYIIICLVVYKIEFVKDVYDLKSIKNKLIFCKFMYNIFYIVRILLMIIYRIIFNY